MINIFLKCSSFGSGGKLRKTAAHSRNHCLDYRASVIGYYYYYYSLDTNMLVLPQKTIKMLLRVLAAKMLTMWQLLVSLFTAFFLFILYWLLNFHRGNKVPDTHQFYQNDKKTNESMEKWETNSRSNKSLTPHSGVTRQPEQGSTSYRPQPDWLPSAEAQSQVHPIVPDY